MSARQKRLLRIVSGMPLWVAHLLGNIVGFFMWVFPNKKRTVTCVNLLMCFPGMSRFCRTMFCLRSLIEDAKTAIETPGMLNLSKEQVVSLVKKVHGTKHIEEAFAAGKSVILCVPHIGNWEIIGLHSSLYYPMTNLYRPQHRSDVMNDLLKQGRERFGAKLIPTDHAGIRSIFKALDQKNLIGILPDQYPGIGQGVSAQFYEHKVKTMTLLPKLFLKNKSVVLYSYARRLPFARGFEIYFEPAQWDESDRNVQAIATQMNQGIERCIERIPEQYWWSYDRYRVMPELILRQRARKS